MPRWFASFVLRIVTMGRVGEKIIENIFIPRDKENAK